MPRRMSRRAFVALSGTVVAGVGAAATAASLRGGGDRRSASTPAPMATQTRAPATTAAATPRPSPTPTPPVPRGELRRVSPRSLNIDTYDAARSGEVSLAEILGRTHSRLVVWHDPANAELEGDLALKWESPDALQWVFTLRADAEWQPTESQPSRRLTASDVAAHFERVVALAAEGQLPGAQRPWAYGSIERIESPDDVTFIVDTHTPDPWLLDTLAGPFAFVQRREVVEQLEAAGPEHDAALLSGTGPFQFKGWAGSGLAFGPADASHRMPRVAGLHVRHPVNDPGQLLSADIDEFIARDRRHAEALRGGAGIVEGTVYEDSPLLAGFFMGAAPWSDVRLRQAISSTLNRITLAGSLFGGRSDASGPVPPSAAAFAPNETALRAFPGYREPRLDAQEARAAWEAADGPSLGPVEIDVPAVFDPRYPASSVLPSLFADVLGVEARVSVDSYVNIARKIAGGVYGNGRLGMWFGWGPALLTPEGSRYLSNAYHSAGASAREAGFADAEVDRVLERIAAEFDIEAREELAREAQSMLLSTSAGGHLPLLLQRAEHFRRSYAREFTPSPFTLQHNDWLSTVDTANPAYPTSRPQ